MSVEPDTIQLRSPAVAAAVAATMAALPTRPTAPADLGAAAATGQGRERVGFGGAAPRDREPEHAWLPGLLVGLAALAFGLAQRRGNR